MCVRTKISYGCGHEFKTTTDCGLPRCQGLERYHYPRRGDCRDCKAGGEAVTRGIEGKGRYAREISRRTHSREPVSDSSDDAGPAPAPATLLPVDVGVGIGGRISPWSSEPAREKEWNSPSRRRADAAWLEEHVERNLELETIRESISSYTPSERASPSLRGGGRIYIVEEEPQSLHDLDGDRHYRQQRRGGVRGVSCRGDRSPLVEVRSVVHHHHPQYQNQHQCQYQQHHQHLPHHDDDAHEGRSHEPMIYRRRHRRDQDSQESIESMRSSTRSSTRKHTRTPTTYTTYDERDREYDCHDNSREYDHMDHDHEHHDSGYGSYGSRASNGHGHHEGGGAKTEPYPAYSSSPSPRIVTVRPPTLSSSPSHKFYHSGFGPGLAQGQGPAQVDIITRAPLYTYPARRH